jgi:hypothetical protein
MGELLNPGSNYVDRDEERRRLVEARAGAKYAVFLTPAQIHRLIIAVANDTHGAAIGDHELYIHLANVYDSVTQP